MRALFAVLERYQLRTEFPETVRAEVDACLARTGIDDVRLKDLDHLPFVTIDNEDSRDLDQALYIESADDDIAVYYALADASYFVRPGSALFQEALLRGTSFYLPGFSVPMLPRALSEGIVSLNEGEARRALVMRILLDAAGAVKHTELMRARIRSRRKLSYAGVQAYFDAPEASPLKDRPYTASLELLAHVGRLRLADAERRHVVRYDRGEIETAIDPDDHDRFLLWSRDRNDVERWNEQISLLSNIEGARFLAEGEANDAVQPIFRVHAAPPASRLRELVARIDKLTEQSGLDPDVWRWDPKERPLASYLRRLPEGRLRKAIQRQALVINQRSTFSEAPGRHHGVGAEPYARFSAPMREVVGIYTHKEAFEKLGEAASEGDESLRSEVLEVANRSKELQKRVAKEAHKLVLDQFFTRREKPMVGTVMGLSKSKIYVELDDPPIEVKVYTRDLPGEVAVDDARTEMDIAGQKLRLGAEVSLTVDAHDPGRNVWRFALRFA